MARLEQAITSIVDIFTEYADKKTTDDQVLCKAELQELLQKEIESEFKGRINMEDINEVMEKLDKDNDDKIDFKEFCRCVRLLAISCYCKKTGQVLKGKGKGKGKGKKGKGKGKGRRQGKGKGGDDDEDEDEDEGEGEGEGEEAEED